MRAKRYSASSIREWYNNRIREMNEWIEGAQRKIERCDREFDAMLSRIRSKRFTSADYGTCTVFDFYENEVRIERGDSYDKYYVNFKGYNVTYGWKPIPDTVIHFRPYDAPKTWFSDYYEY